MINLLCNINRNPIIVVTGFEIWDFLNNNIFLKHFIGYKLTGTMKNNGAVTKKITTRDEEVTIPQGFHDGSGKVGIDATEKGKLIANNIREGVTILGVEGTMSGSENMKPQAKTVTPSTAKQTILPDTEYNCLSQVEVEAIPYVEADNPAGGVTVTIAG